MNNLAEPVDLMMVELNENFLEESVFTTHDIDNDDQEAMKAYIKLIALLISSENPEILIDTIISNQTAEVTMESEPPGEPSRQKRKEQEPVRSEDTLFNSEITPQGPLNNPLSNTANSNTANSKKQRLQ